MADIQQVFVHPGCPHCWKVFVAAEFVGKAQDVVFLSWDQIKEPEYLKKNPTGKVPCVTTPQGPLFESHAILRTLARSNPEKQLYGKNNFESARVDQWLDWSSEFSTTFPSIFYGIIGKQVVDEKAFSQGLENVRTKLKGLEEHLNGRKYVATEQPTIADLSIVSILRGAVAFALDAEFRKEFPRVFEYFHNVSSLPEVVKSLGRVRYCETRLPLYQPPQPKKEEKKQPEKKAEGKKKKDDDDDDEDKPEPPKKDDAKAELENLPPSKFNFFDFKTLITNSTDKKEALKAFWEQYDPEGYSLWFVEYEKAEGEGKVVYLTNNLMNGFLQRLDHFRKYCYGVYGVYGDEPNLEVRGVFCWRGTKIPLLMKEHDQYDYHKFTQLHHTNEADKKKVEEFWTKLNEDEDVVDGYTARTVKPFK